MTGRAGQPSPVREASTQLDGQDQAAHPDEGAAYPAGASGRGLAEGGHGGRRAAGLRCERHRTHGCPGQGTAADAGHGGIAGAKSASGAVEARVLGREAAKKADVDGLLFTLRSKGEGKDGPTGRACRVRAKLDYSGFAEAYGGGYAPA
ncbi:hypothetical protein ACR6C2_16210 [Streptomyces sp. INA 01156]